MPGKTARLKLAQVLSHSLSGFGDCFHDQLVCPVCLAMLPLREASEWYTMGHIIPESAGGKEWTILCKDCNSKFGKLQDKWFGEYLSLLKNPKATFVDAKTKSKYITVNGKTVSGTISVSKVDGAIEVFVPINRNPPGEVNELTIDDKLTVQFTPELVKHVDEIQIGYITAGYLMWFKEIGYNWVMQTSQELVRKQIVGCDYGLEGAKVVELQGDKLHEPAIGVIVKSDYVYPCCMMYDRVVIFPSPSGSKAPPLQVASFDGKYDIRLLNLEILNVPYSVIYDGDLVVMPDMLRKNPPIPESLLYIHGSGDKKSEWLTMKK